VPLDALTDDGHGAEHFRALDIRDRGLTRAIVATALRRRGEIDAALKRCLDRPLPPDSGALSAILHVGAAQILFLDVPDHAAVSLAVAHASLDRTARNARGLANSVLRRVARERAEIVARADAARLNAPEWLFARWSAAYGEAAAEAIAEAHLLPPGLDFSVKGEPEIWAERLGGIVLPTGTVRVAEGRRVSALPGYAEGAWWIQDAAAALPARLLGDVAGKHVADLCAAPGEARRRACGSRRQGDSRRHLGQPAPPGFHEPDASASPGRDARRRRPCLGPRASNSTPCLLDAPCSATGTIRRHPDVQWLKQPQDIATLSALQARLMDRAADLVAPGGVLVFCTCSLEAEEGEAQIVPFLARRPQFALEPIAPAELAGLTHLASPAGTLRTLPCHSFGLPIASDEHSPDLPDILIGMDGFFAARFRRA
jgi:16S rRNA (cytosine967-C5)-methyltransferase